jgi:hypothetical protein
MEPPDAFREYGGSLIRPAIRMRLRDDGSTLERSVGEMQRTAPGKPNCVPCSTGFEPVTFGSGGGTGFRPKIDGRKELGQLP